MNKYKQYITPVLIAIGFIAYFGITLHFVGQFTHEVKEAIYKNIIEGSK